MSWDQSGGKSVMAPALQDLRRLVNELNNTQRNGLGNDATETALKVADLAMQELDEGPLWNMVMGDGGVHGSPEAAFNAWTDLATETGNNLRRAIGYTTAWEPGNLLVRFAQKVRDGGAVVGAAVVETVTAAGWGFGSVLAVWVLWQLFGGRRRG